MCSVSVKKKEKRKQSPFALHTTQDQNHFFICFSSLTSHIESFSSIVESTSNIFLESSTLLRFYSNFVQSIFLFLLDFLQQSTKQSCCFFSYYCSYLPITRYILQKVPRVIFQKYKSDHVHPAVKPSEYFLLQLKCNANP